MSITPKETSLSFLIFTYNLFAVSRVMWVKVLITGELRRVPEAVAYKYGCKKVNYYAPPLNENQELLEIMKKAFGSNTTAFGTS